MSDDLPSVTVKLWRADAVVLFDWLASTDLNAVPIVHPAQKQALADLATALEWGTDVMASTEDEVATAQEAVARDMGW
ncbi:hypothetical protein [Streptomyces sp. G-5]|uniref:hypothetical protein n=1 Tax=Streptomyces sp. G-5 TaxID=2977231 RepID=UPI0021D1AE09|nr:hypothetical protein [Streptomyces sp. G-5]MCU4749465.1 hypothetical protein [Streptomyces sp. G-5]